MNTNHGKPVERRAHGHSLSLNSVFPAWLPVLRGSV